MEYNGILLTEELKKLILLLSKKNSLNADRKNAQWRVRYYNKIHSLKKDRSHWLPKKWKSKTLSDINFLMLKNEADVLKSRIKILNFNKKYLNKIHSLVNKIDAADECYWKFRIRYDGANFISLVGCPSKQNHIVMDSLIMSLSVQDIRKIARDYETTLAVENMLTKE